MSELPLTWILFILLPADETAAVADWQQSLVEGDVD